MWRKMLPSRYALTLPIGSQLAYMRVRVIKRAEVLSTINKYEAGVKRSFFYNIELNIS